jgi:hypothetical protein
VAVIGADTVWRSEIDRDIRQLPPETQKAYSGDQARVQFLRQRVGTELVYRAALREHYEQNPELVAQKEQMVKNLVVEHYLFEQVFPRQHIDSMDVYNYYRANRDTRYGGAPLDSVRVQVMMDYQTDKAEAAYGEYIQKLAESEHVTFLDHNL